MDKLAYTVVTDAVTQEQCRRESSVEEIADPNAMDDIEAVHLVTVLQDCIDQLVVLGRIMPASYENRPDAEEV